MQCCNTSADSDAEIIPDIGLDDDPSAMDNQDLCHISTDDGKIAV